jgi:hypothetical protein
MGMLAGGADIVQLEERSKRACKKAAFNGARSKARGGMAAATSACVTSTTDAVRPLP